MIKEAKLGKELVVTVPNKIGALADVVKILADRGINVEGVAGYGKDKEARLMILSSDALRAKEALEKSGYKAITENEVILVELENKPGALKGMTGKLADSKIDINYIYGTTCPAGCPARIVLATSNNEKAVVSFNTK